MLRNCHPPSIHDMKICGADLQQCGMLGITIFMYDEADPPHTVTQVKRFQYFTDDRVIGRHFSF